MRIFYYCTQKWKKKTLKNSTKHNLSSTNYYSDKTLVGVHSFQSMWTQRIVSGLLSLCFSCFPGVEKCLMTLVCVWPPCCTWCIFTHQQHTNTKQWSDILCRLAWCTCSGLLVWQGSTLTFYIALVQVFHSGTRHNWGAPKVFLSAFWSCNIYFNL